MNKKSNLEFYVMMGIIALGQAGVILAINLMVNGIFERFLWAFATSLTIFGVSAMMRKYYGRDAFKSKRDAMGNFLMLMLNAVLFSIGAIALISIFLNDGEPFMELNGDIWISGIFLLRYLFVYAVIYGLEFLIISVILVRV